MQAYILNMNEMFYQFGLSHAPSWSSHSLQLITLSEAHSWHPQVSFSAFIRLSEQAKHMPVVAWRITSNPFLEEA